MQIHRNVINDLGCGIIVGIGRHNFFSLFFFDFLAEYHQSEVEVDGAYKGDSLSYVGGAAI